jgi:hypothetical protein
LREAFNIIPRQTFPNEKFSGMKEPELLNTASIQQDGKVFNDRDHAFNCKGYSDRTYEKLCNEECVRETCPNKKDADPTHCYEDAELG